MSTEAIVIGAGIGGLSAARALKRHGWTVTVLEQGSGLPTTGTMLGMWPAAIKALDGIGIDAQARRADGWTTISSAAGSGLWTPGRKLVTAPGGMEMNLVARPALLRALAEGVDISFNSRVDGPAEFPGAALVVGAGGINSGSRRQMFGEQFAARSLESVAWRGTVRGAVSEYGETWAPGALFGITPAGPDATNWYACINADHTFAEPYLPRLEALFGSWKGPVREVMDRIQEGAILHHQLFETPTLPSFVRGNTALIGDAAHAMAPFLGRGACEALVDGVALGRSLAGAATLDAGLAAYDKERRRRTQRLVRASRLMGKVAMMRRGAGIRDAAVGGAGRLMRLRAKRP